MAKLTLVEPDVPTPLAALVDDFLADRRAHGLSVRTIGSYEHPLRREFLPWCTTQRISDPAQLTPQLADGFTTQLLEHGGRHGALARASVRTYVRSVRVFLGWIASARGGAHVVGGSPPLPKAGRVVIDVLSTAEINAMENRAASERDKLIVRVLADCGLRLGELLALRGTDMLEPKRGEFALKVHGKGDAERLVPVAPALYRRLQRYRSGRHADPHDRVFVALRKGPSGRYEPLTPSGVGQAIRVLAQEAGLTKRVYPHLFRHSYATNWLRRGGNVVMLQQNLGHADLTMITNVYEHLNSSDKFKETMRVLMGDE